MSLEDLTLYVKNCAGCDDWSEYEYVNRAYTKSGTVLLNFRCPQCGSVRVVSFKWNKEET